ncbi:pseudouridine synthase [Pterulicium gracile]|uniref:21S rRNA pseudouridine(2819) synthase n=1 Tax=Pterulicium gracile TaxID=1884261 RepID=A0A5C3Q4D9_9AGAR|nr:pseudouridine synthase [Pterula gracilis]
MNNVDILKNILYHDRAVIVLNKPAGLVAQGGSAPTPPDRDPRTSYYLANVLEELKVTLGLSEAPYTVHRLDKGTTGCLVLAKTPHAAKALSNQFNRRDAAPGDDLHVEKRYFSLVQNAKSAAGGEIRTPLVNRDGRMSAALAPRSADSPGVEKEAATDWKLLSTANGLSLLELNLLTGVKHPLRVHLSKCINAPILGDDLYGPEVKASDKDIWSPTARHSRIYLHARELSFYRYLRTGSHRQIRITVAAPLPPLFLALCQEMGVQIADEWVHGAVRLKAVQRWKPAEEVLSSLEGHAGEGIRCSYDEPERQTQEWAVTKGVETQ